ncbi:MAG: hypothetical protein ACR2PO_06580 [Methyloligellaceae bacterium]
MRADLTALLAFIAISIAATSALGQKSTEQFIPLGKSPGVSGVSSYIGRIEAVDTGKRTITVAGDEGPRTIAITARTKIWVDLSKYKAANVIGTIEDCKAGRRIEAKMEGDQKQTAAWIKVVPEKAP